MKKVLLFIVISVILILSSCVRQQTHVEQILDEIRFGFFEDDDFSHITNDFTLTRTSKLYEEALLIWDLSSIEYAKLENDLIKITRPKDEDFELILTLTIIYQEEELVNDFIFIIKYEEGEIINPVDPGKPTDPETVFYQVTYKDEKETVKRVRYEKGTKLTLTETLTKEGYIFYGWSLNDEIVKEITITKNITLTAVFNDVSITASTQDEIDLLNDLNEFNFRYYFFTENKTEWPKKWVRGSVASYEILNQNDKKYFNFEKDLVTPPKDEYLKTKVKLTLTKGSFSESKEVEVHLGKPPIISIGDLNNITKEDVFVRVNGTVTGSYFENKLEYIFFQDEFDSVLLTSLTSFNFPNNLTAELILYNIEDKFEIISYEISKKQNKIEPVYIYSEDLFNSNLNKIVYLEAVVTKGVTNKEFEIYFNNKYKVYIKDNKTTSVQPLTYISFNGYITSIDDEEVIIITDVSSIESDKLSNVEVADLIMSSVNFSSSVISMNSNITLLKTDPIFNSTISYEVKNNLAIIDNDILLVPNDVNEFVLIAHIKLNNNVTISREFKVIVIK